MDRLAKINGKKIVEATVTFAIRKQRLKLWIAWLKCTGKKIIETTV